MYQLYVIEKETIIMEDIQSVVTIKELYSLDQTMAKPLLEKLTYPWEALPLIKDFVLELGKSLDKDEYNEVDEHVWIHKSCKVYGTATILGPTIIGRYDWIYIVYHNIAYVLMRDPSIHIKESDLIELLKD